MARQLPDDPRKRKLQIFKRLYQHLEHFKSLQEAGRFDFDGVLSLPGGEDIDLCDLMVGLPYLPRRQREAFVLICLQGYTESAARDELLPDSKSSTPVQQYADSGLARMVDHYEAKQAGFWPPLETIKLVKNREGNLVLPTTPHPLVKRHLESARKDIIVQIEGLKVALAQVDDMLGAISAPAKDSLSKPEGKPDLGKLAKELAHAG